MFERIANFLQVLDAHLNGVPRFILRRLFSQIMEDQKHTFLAACVVSFVLVFGIFFVLMFGFLIVKESAAFFNLVMQENKEIVTDLLKSTILEDQKICDSGSIESHITPDMVMTYFLNRFSDTFDSQVQRYLPGETTLSLWEKANSSLTYLQSSITDQNDNLEAVAFPQTHALIKIALFDRDWSRLNWDLLNLSYEEVTPPTIDSFSTETDHAELWSIG